MTKKAVQKLIDQLSRRFQAQVEAEQVSPGRFRINMVSPQFAGVTPLKRQDKVWDVLDQLLDRESTLDISIVLAFSPDEVEVVPNA